MKLIGQNNGELDINAANTFHLDSIARTFEILTANRSGIVELYLTHLVDFLYHR